MKLKPPQLRIDADFFCFRSAAAAEEELELDEDLTVIIGNLSEGQKVFTKEITNLQEKFDSKDVLLTWTDRHNFRKDIDPAYKSNRKKRKPAGYLRLKKWAMETWPSLTIAGIEADDVLGIICTKDEDTNFVLVSPDKDLKQIPCRQFDLKDEYTVEPEDAELQLYTQCLTGDSVDGFKGIPGVGPKKAQAILAKAQDGLWPACVEAYEKAGLSHEDALRNLRLARILQASDWDETNQQPILFTP